MAWDIFNTKPAGLETTGDFSSGGIVTNKGGVTHSRHAGLYQNFTISFKSMIAASIAADFPAILTSFSDNWVSNWDSKDLYGRMDQVHTFKNTTRQISFSFAVVPDDAPQSADSMAQFENLVRMLYPTYESAPDESATEYQAMNVNLIRQAPIMGIKMGNLIRSPDSNGYLLGKVAGFSFAPDIEAGFWLSSNAGTGGSGSPPVERGDGAQYFPKKWEVQVEFTVMHTSPLAQNASKGWVGDKSYPYSAKKLIDDIPDSERQDVVIEYGPGYVNAKIPKKVKKSFSDKILGALFKL